jgi:hypothetical protein
VHFIASRVREPPPEMARLPKGSGGVVTARQKPCQYTLKITGSLPG